MPLVALLCGSASTRRVRRSAMASEAARFTAVVVFPTPPFWLATAMIRAIVSTLSYYATTTYADWRGGVGLWERDRKAEKRGQYSQGYGIGKRPNRLKRGGAGERARFAASCPDRAGADGWRWVEMRAARAWSGRATRLAAGAEGRSARVIVDRGLSPALRASLE